jgi:hypothetical protein
LIKDSEKRVQNLENELKKEKEEIENFRRFLL